MIHSVSGGVFGNVFEAMNENKELQRLQHLMTTTLQKETKMSAKDIEKMMKAGHDYYMTPEDAVKAGIVDKIIGDKTLRCTVPQNVLSIVSKTVSLRTR
jgi:ATP-dependent protease ClpP protease subunit